MRDDAADETVGSEIRPGMRVALTDGGDLGLVRDAVGVGYFEVEREGRPSWFVPVDLVQRFEDDIVVLALTLEQAEKMEWSVEPSAESG